MTVLLSFFFVWGAFCVQKLDCRRRYAHYTRTFG